MGRTCTWARLIGWYTTVASPVVIYTFTYVPRCICKALFCRRSYGPVHPTVVSVVLVMSTYWQPGSTFFLSSGYVFVVVAVVGMLNGN